jgi:hypothetical protein
MVIPPTRLFASWAGMAKLLAACLPTGLIHSIVTPIKICKSYKKKKKKISVCIIILRRIP